MGCRPHIRLQAEIAPGTIDSRAAATALMRSLCDPQPAVRIAASHALGAYAARRTAQGKSKPEILRCLKRYLARDLYRLLVGPRPTAAHAPPLAA